jgi:hypothetical protein
MQLRSDSEFQHCNWYVGHVLLFSLFIRYNKISRYKQNCVSFLLARDV